MLQCARHAVLPDAARACVCCSVLGTPFYLMEHVPGRVFKDVLLPELNNEQRRTVYSNMCRVLSRIHQVDIHAAGLDSYGKPGKTALKNMTAVCVCNSLVTHCLAHARRSVVTVCVFVTR